MLIPADLISTKVESLGLKRSLFTTTDKGSLGWNSFGWEQFLANLCHVRYITTILRMIGRPVSFIMQRFEKTEGKGSAYTLIFKKELPE
jgi:hypothetical protein